MGDKRTSARMSTAREAGDQILKIRVRELVAENRTLRRRILELQRKEMVLRDRIIRAIRQEFDQLPKSPTSPERSEASTQTDGAASGSVRCTPAPLPVVGTTPGGSGARSA